LVATALCLFTPYFELAKPDIKTTSSIERVGQRKTVTIVFSDNKSGIRHIDISIAQDNRNYALAALDIKEKGVTEKSVAVDINPSSLKLHDGEATLTITAKDHSLFGNTARLVQKVTIDMTPPQVSLLSSYHNINPGGTCLAVYKISKEIEKSGIIAGSDFFTGYPVSLEGKTIYMAYFPIPVDIDKNSVKLSVFAKDRAGNEASSSISYHVKPKKFREDTVEISDLFMTQKMPEFQQRDANLRGKSAIETFVYINDKLREENSKTIQTLCGKTTGNRLWQGSFTRMKNAAPMAMFGDRRAYTYQKQKIGESVHLGVDLASTAHAPIEAANSGVVVFAGYLGIYGNAIMVDHGLGVFSLYGHMNELKVKEGQQVAQGDVIGVSGDSGLAGGDHLHFSMLVGGRFVNPLEWWDPHWIADNVEKKISETSQPR
jgi:murein DD-endopeptidase MepM/ murein hydrolase activator NlpD